MAFLKRAALPGHGRLQTRYQQETRFDNENLDAPLGFEHEPEQVHPLNLAEIVRAFLSPLKSPAVASRLMTAELHFLKDTLIIF